MKIKVNGGAVTLDDDEAAKVARRILEQLDRHCLYPDCCNTRRTRGQCHQHYQEYRRLVRKDAQHGSNRCLNEAEMIAAGLLLPEGTGGGSAVGKSSAFLKA